PVVTLIQQCLEKDRNSRIGDIAVARFLLSGRATYSASTQAGPAQPGTTHTAAPGAFADTSGAQAKHAGDATAQAAAWVAGQVFGPAAATRVQSLPVPLTLVLPVLAGVLIGGLAIWSLARRPAAASTLVTRLQMSVQPADQLVSSIASPRPSRTAFAISPDGRLVVFSATKNGGVQLYLRPLDHVEATPLQGTEGGISPFFSPDGAWIAFWTDNKIKKVPVAGGPAATICDAAATQGVLGGSWD